MGSLVDASAIEVAVLPVDATGAAQAGDWVSMKNYSRLTIIITQGAWAAGTSAVTLDQATAIAGTGTKTLGFDFMWTKVGITGTTFTKTAVVSDTFNLPNVANTISVIEIQASSLDVDGGFDCVQLDLGSPGANADLVSAVYILHGPRFAQGEPPDPKVD